MDMAAAFLADHASVRDNLLFVSGGGVTRLWRDEFPAKMGVHLALIFELHQTELEKPHELEIIVQSEDGERVGELQGGFQVGADVGVGEHALVPVTVDLRDAALAKAGRYSIEISIAGAHRKTLQFRAGPREQ